jgi:hypothetical protein
MTRPVDEPFFVEVTATCSVCACEIKLKGTTNEEKQKLFTWISTEPIICESCKQIDWGCE